MRESVQQTGEATVLIMHRCFNCIKYKDFQKQKKTIVCFKCTNELKISKPFYLRNKEQQDQHRQSHVLCWQHRQCQLMTVHA